MRTGVVRELRRCWRPAAVSVGVCAVLGAVLQGLVQPSAPAGRWTWALIGAGCAVAVGLAWPLVVARRGGTAEAAAAGTQASALAQLTAAGRHRARLVRVVIGLALGVTLCAGAVGVYEASRRRPDEPVESAPSTARIPQPPPPTATSVPRPRPEPTIRIGDHILVRAPHRPAVDR